MVNFHQFSRKNKFVVEIHQKNMLLCQKKVPENGGFPPFFWIFEKSDFLVVFHRFLGFLNMKFKCIFGKNSCHQMVKIRWVSTEFSDFRKINKYGGFLAIKKTWSPDVFFMGTFFLSDFFRTTISPNFNDFKCLKYSYRKNIISCELSDLPNQSFQRI
jgi:hypothetical protein